MNQNLALFLLFLAAGLPLFVLILLEKCVDLRSYRKLGMTDKIAKVWSLEILILVVSQVLNALAACLLITNFNDISALILLYFPPLPIWALIVLYLFERKNIHDALHKHSFKTKLLVTNLVLPLAFHISYQYFLLWYIIGDDLLEPTTFKQHMIFGIGNILLIILFVFIKILVQKQLVKRIRNQLLTEQVPSGNTV